MVLFGNKTNNTGTVWDNAMNYGCGSLQMVLVLIGVPLNVYLYYFHWQKRISWTARFYRFMSIPNLGLVLLEALPQGAYLLMPDYLRDSETTLSVFNEVLELVSECLWSYHKILVFMLSLMQYLYIHQPYWTIVHGFKFKKLMMAALVLVIVFLTIAFILSLSIGNHEIFGFSNGFETFFAKDETAVVLMIICIQVPDYLFIFSCLVLYILTRRNLRFNTDIELTDKIRSDFRAIGLIVSNAFLWMVLKIASSVLLYRFEDLSKIPYVYIYFVYSLNNVLPGLMATLSSIYVLFCYEDVRITLSVLIKTGKFDPFPYDML
jgi:hypothetical protein